tara:strand:+ start:1028 stop:1885 length:858 start_codon:yes stop_codon:yes gene_type:complete
MKCNLFIIGAAKSGTTSLCEYITQHPKVFIPNIKEPHFFSNIKQTTTTRVINNIKEYSQLYKNRKEQYLCDGSTSYLFFSKRTALKIKKYNKHAKIILLLRNPIDRLYSHYLMAKEMVGEEVNDIRFVINEDYRTKQGYHDSKVNPYLAPSFYFKNVEEYLNRFSKENVHIVIFEDLIANLDHEMSQIFSFLNLENICVNSKIYNSYKKMRNTYLNKVIFNKQSAFLKTIIPRKIKYFLKNILYKKSEKPTLDKKIREKLHIIFNDDIEKLYKLTQKESILKWKK